MTISWPFWVLLKKWCVDLFKNTEFIRCFHNFFLRMFLITSTLDTGHFFHTSPIQCLICLGIGWCQDSKIWNFFKGLRSFRGPQKQKRKTNGFFLFNEVLKNLIFFQSLIKKVGFMTLIVRKFPIPNSKRFNYKVRFHLSILKN